jgi:alginate O-acetyltransferase complex protein AlgI
MTIVALPFLLTALVSIFLLRLRWLRAWRVEILALASLGFAGAITGSVGDALCLALMTVTGWVAIRRIAHDKRRRVLATAIGCIVAEFILSRQILPQVQAPDWLLVGGTVGLSYVMFRIIHMIVDAHGDELPVGLRKRDYVCFLFSYLTFLAGPIQRVQDFAASMAPSGNAAPPGAMRRCLPMIVTGYLQFTLVAALCFACFSWSERAENASALSHAAGWLGFAAYLYFSFAGYTDVVRGLGGLAGLDLPPNFDRPYASANFLDVWARWHISLSDWFKLYVFNPAVKEMIAANSRPALIPTLGAAGYFMTFFLMGLWHGVSLRFVLYGLCLGAGVSANKLYQTTMLRRLGRKRLAELSRQPLYMIVSQAAAVAFFILALGFLWIPTGAIARDGIPVWAGGGGVVILACLVLALVTRLTARSAKPHEGGSLFLRGVLIAVQLAAILIYLYESNGTAPPLLYAFF